jgi:hypothetical protein
MTIFLNSKLQELMIYDPMAVKNLKIIASQSLNGFNKNKILNCFEQIEDLID